MVAISLCMIVKDEEAVLGRCLESVKNIVDEIIVVDTGSTDETKRIARDYGSKVYDFEWKDDFAAARNFSFSKASMDYILWLDADDVILEEDRESFLKLRQMTALCADIVMMKYCVGTDRLGDVRIYRERLLKRSSRPFWKGVVHECIPINGEVIFSDVTITHKKVKSTAGRNLKILEKAIKDGVEELDSRNMFYMGKELFEAGKYEEGIKYYKMLLNSDKNQAPYSMEACLDICRYYMLKKEKEDIPQTLIEAFAYDLPRAEICCYLGAYYREMNDYRKAISWYETAIALEKPQPYMDYVINDYWGYIPCVELCHCYYKTGSISEAISYNEMAAQYKPDDPGIEQNNEFFRGLLQGYSSCV